jgi:hypothetical protein
LGVKNLALGASVPVASDPTMVQRVIGSLVDFDPRARIPANDPSTSIIKVAQRCRPRRRALASAAATPARTPRSSGTSRGARCASRTAAVWCAPARAGREGRTLLTAASSSHPTVPGVSGHPGPSVPGRGGLAPSSTVTA